MKKKTFKKDFMLNKKSFKQSELTKIAHLMLEEYREVFDSTPSDDIAYIAEQIKKHENIEPFEDCYTYTSNGYRDEYAICESTIEVRISATNKTDEDGNTIYTIYWHFYANDIYTAYINGKKLVSDDRTEIIALTTAEKGKYRYFCTHRPPTKGCIPEGFITYVAYSVLDTFKGEVTYNQDPAEEELKRWGLVPDPTWQEVQRIRMGDQAVDIN